MSDPIDYAVTWIEMQFDMLRDNFLILRTCCIDAAGNFDALMSEPDFPSSIEELVNELLLDAICSVPGLVFLKNLHALEKKELVHQVAFAAERVGKVLESVATVEGKSNAAYSSGADQIRTVSVKKVKEAILADVDGAKNRVVIKKERVVLWIKGNKDKLPKNFKELVLHRVQRVDPLSKVQAKQATNAYEERIFRFWAKHRVTIVKTDVEQQAYGNHTEYSLQGYKFNDKQLDYIKETFEVTPSNMHTKWGVPMKETHAWRSSRGMY